MLSFFYEKKNKRLAIAVFIFIGFIFLFELEIFANRMTTDAMISELQSKNSEDVEKILVYISNTKPEELLPHLNSIIISKKHTQKDRALKALKCYPVDKILPLCIDILKKTSSFLIKKDMIEFLATSNDRRVVIPIAMELDNPFFVVRESAVIALKSLDDDRMFSYILNMMEDPNPVFRVYALQAIFHLYDIRFYNLLVHMLRDENKSIRYYVLKSIEKHGLKKSLKYVRRIALTDQNFEVKIKAIQTLATLYEDKSLYVLISCLNDQNRDVRLSAATALNKITPKATSLVISRHLYSEEDDEIKRILINTLIKLNKAGRHKGLRKIMLYDNNSELRILAAYALGIIRDNVSLSILIKGLNDKDFKVRSEVCNSLGNYRQNGVVIELLNILNDDSSRYVRTAALYSIERIGKPLAILPLFDRYAIENDIIVKNKLRLIIKKLIKKYA